MRFTTWEPPLAGAALECSAVMLVCFGFLCALLWLGRWVVSIFEAEQADEEDEP